MDDHIVCYVCGENLANARDYQRHASQIHNIPIPNCHRCQIYFITYDEMQSHLRSAHNFGNLGKEERAQLKR